MFNLFKNSDPLEFAHEIERQAAQEAFERGRKCGEAISAMETMVNHRGNEPGMPSHANFIGPLISQKRG